MLFGACSVRQTVLLSTLRASVMPSLGKLGPDPIDLDHLNLAINLARLLGFIEEANPIFSRQAHISHTMSIFGARAASAASYSADLGVQLGSWPSGASTQLQHICCLDIHDPICTRTMWRTQQDYSSVMRKLQTAKTKPGILKAGIKLPPSSCATSMQPQSVPNHVFGKLSQTL